MNRLFIQGFGPVKKADLEIKSVNLLIGEQSIGKSTIAKLIAIFTDNGSLAQIASSGIKAWNTRLLLYDLEIYKDDDYRIEYEYQEGRIRLSIRVLKTRVYTSLLYNGKRISDKKEIYRTILAQRKEIYKNGFFESLVEDIKDNKKEDIKYQIFSLHSLIESSLYVPAERIAYSIIENLKSALSLIGDATTYTYRRFMVSFDKARARIKKYESPILRITYLNEEDGQYFVEHETQKKYHLYNASSGIQSTIPLLIVLDDIKNRFYSSIVIEEPETNLFPNTQVEVLKSIIEKARVNGSIVTITTHSPYLLSAFNNYLYSNLVSQHIKDDATHLLDAIIPPSLRLNSKECSVYSVGESINGGKGYCVSIIDETTGMIDSNSLDEVSYSMSRVFDSLQEVFLKYSK